MKIEFTDRLRPRIYVVSLNGKAGEDVEGQWIDATRPRHFITNEIRELVGRSEMDLRGGWEVHDAEGFGPLKIPKSAHLDTILRAARLVWERGTLAAEIIRASGGIEHLDAAEDALSQYVGSFSSHESYVRWLVDAAYARTSPWFPVDWRTFINIEALTEDMFPDGNGTGSLMTLKCGDVYHIFDWRPC